MNGDGEGGGERGNHVVPPLWRGWDSNPRSRAHEAREDSRSSTALREKRSGRQESNLRSPVPETGGVADSPTARRNLRVVPPAGLEPAPSGLRARRHLPFDHGGIGVDGPGVEPGLPGASDRCVPTLARRRRISPGGIEPPSSTFARWCSTAELRRAAAFTRARTEGIEPSPAGLEPALTPRLVRVSCDGWARTSILRVTTGRPAVGRRRIEAIRGEGLEPPASSL